jgi:exopolysaccharide biosynthesis polyprenyl glycosylphosphotransferase
MAEPITHTSQTGALRRPLRRLWQRTAQHWLITPLLVLSDGLAVYLAHRLALTTRIALLAADDPIPPEAPYKALAWVSCLVALVVFALWGLYGERTSRSRWRERMQMGVAAVAVGMVDLAVVFFDRRLTVDGFTFSRAAWFLTIGYGWVLLGSGRSLVRGLQGGLRRLGWGVRRTLIVGTDALARMVAERQLAEPALGYDLIGFASVREWADGLPAAILGGATALPDLILTHRIDSVIIAVPDLPRQELLPMLTAVRQMPDVDVQLVPDIVEFFTTRMRVSDVAGLPLVGLQTTPLQRWHNRALKRAFDAAFALLALLVTAPLLLLIALAVKLSSPGPVLYRQERLSRGGKPFEILKFRTMRQHAEAGTGPVWAAANDDRRTAVGTWLRRASLDELPQFLNVLRGDMSVVGPRPERPFFTDRFGQEIVRYTDRHLVKSGLTGWAQIHGLRGDVPISDRTAHDLYYIENWSLWLDLQIIVQSLRCVVDDFRTGRAG